MAEEKPTILDIIVEHLQKSGVTLGPTDGCYLGDAGGSGPPIFETPYTDDMIRPEECPACPEREGWMMFESEPAFIPQGFFDDPDTFKTTQEFLEWIDDPETDISDEQRDRYRATVERFMDVLNKYLGRDEV